MRQLDYQLRVLDVLDAYLDVLKPEKAKAEKVAVLAAQNPELGLTPHDYAEAAWKSLRAAGRLPASRADIPFSPRHDGIGRVVPNVTFKVPTGGGKTYLAVNAISRIMGRIPALCFGLCRTRRFMPKRSNTSKIASTLIARRLTVRQRGGSGSWKRVTGCTPPMWTGIYALWS